jgi:hypothetical protein
MPRLARPILHRFGHHLALLVLAGYLAAVTAAAGLPVLTLGGAAGWAAGMVAAAALGQAARVPCGRLMRRLVDG